MARSASGPSAICGLGTTSDGGNAAIGDGHLRVVDDASTDDVYHAIRRHDNDVRGSHVLNANDQGARQEYTRADSGRLKHDYSL
jgi:hypothetical protein